MYSSARVINPSSRKAPRHDSLNLSLAIIRKDFFLKKKRTVKICLWATTPQRNTIWHIWHWMFDESVIYYCIETACIQSSAASKYHSQGFWHIYFEILFSTKCCSSGSKKMCFPLAVTSFIPAIIIQQLLGGGVLPDVTSSNLSPGLKIPATLMVEVTRHCSIPASWRPWLLLSIWMDGEITLAGDAEWDRWVPNFY